MTHKKNSTPQPDPYILPSDNNEMRKFVTKFKVDMMENVVSSIKFAVDNKMNIVEVFSFKNSPFVVTINEREFMPNLSHIRQYYMDNEMYELCLRVEKLCETLKTHEKENPDSNGTNPSSS